MKTALYISRSLVTSLLITSLFLPTLGIAQATNPACMIKKTKGKVRGDHDFTLVVPKSSVAEMTRRGFKQRGCGGRRAETAPKVARQMCSLAEQNLPGVEASFVQEYGITPTEICAMSRQISAK